MVTEVGIQPNSERVHRLKDTPEADYSSLFSDLAEGDGDLRSSSSGGLLLKSDVLRHEVRYFA